MSDEKAPNIVWDGLSSLFQIAGFFLALAGFWITVFDFAGGITILVSGSGPTLLISGIIAFAAGARMNAMEDRRIERSYLLPSSPEPSTAQLASTKRTPRIVTCSSCGYENDDAGVFCVACNSPIWVVGSPKGPPPSREMVMHKIRREKIMRKVRPVFKAVWLSALILAILVSGVLGMILAVSYPTVNQSRLAVAFRFFPDYLQTTGTLDITWMIFYGYNVTLSTSGPAYDVRINNIRQNATACHELYPVNIDDPGSSGCRIFVRSVNGTELSRASVTVKVTTVASLYMYSQQISRSVSVFCDSKCVAPDGSPWFY